MNYENEKSIVKRWWKELDIARTPASYETPQQTRFSSKESAELRRSKSIDDVILNSTAFHDLRNRLSDTKWKNIERIALIAGVLSHVRYNKDVFLPKILAKKTTKDASKNAILLRFRRLIQYQDFRELFRPMIRHLDLVENKANISHLANSLYYWSDQTRKDWAISFYEELNK